MFKLTEFTEAHVASVTNRQETHGDEKKAGVSLGLRITAANYLLDSIDPTLRQALFKSKDEAASVLPGVEESTPVLRSNSIESVDLPTKHEGWTMQVDFTGNEESTTTFGTCKVDKFVVTPKQGGSIELALRVGTSDLDPAGLRLGALGMHNGQSIWIKLLPPEKKPEAIDGSTEAFKKDHPDAGGTATDLFAGNVGKGPEDEGDEEDGSGNPDAQMGKDWPFPGDASGQPPAEGAGTPAAVAAKSRRGRKTDAVGEVH